MQVWLWSSGSIKSNSISSPCKGNCDFHTIEFILKDGKECPAVYQSKNPPLDMMVRGQGISYNFMVQNFHFIKAYFTFWGKQNWPKSIKIWWSQKISEAIFCFSFTDFCPLSHWLAAVMPPLGKIQRAYIALYHTQWFKMPDDLR